jgi:tetratricopeptide (TPR) repeat protein
MTFYLGKVFWPVKLAFDYGRTPESVLASPAVYWSVVVPIIAAGVCLMIWRWFRWPGIAAMLFAAGLLPVLGLVPFDFQMYSTVGDHYLYLSMLGPAVLVAALPIWHRRGVVVAGVVLIAVLAVASHRQSLAWRSPETLSLQNLAVNPRSWASHNNLAMWLLEQGRSGEALVSAETALAHRPGDPLVRRTFVTIATHRAADLAEAGRLDEALRLYERAFEIAPDNAAARRGIELIRAGQGTP